MPDAASSPEAIDCHGLVYRYDRSVDRRALDNLDLKVKTGEAVALLGPNGSGKSTLLGMLAGLRLPEAGTVRIFGLDPATEPAAVRRRVGVVFQHAAVDDKLSVMENMLCHGGLFGLPRRGLEEVCLAHLEALGVADRHAHRVDTLSGGLRRRVELAKALVPEPDLLLMDEPATGLDPAARREFWQAVTDARERTGVTVLLSTHLMDEAARCDRVAVLHAGRTVAIDTPAALVNEVGGDVVTIDPAESTPESAEGIAGRLNRLFDDASAVVTDGTVRVELDDGAAAVPRIAEALGADARAISVGRPTLEDAFFHLTGQAL